MVARNPSCCKADCLVHPEKCCREICGTLCITLEFPDDNDCGCTIVSAEVPWDESEQDFHTTLSCGPVWVDVKYFLDDEDDKCWLKLRSDALGFPEGYEYRWEIGVDACCDLLDTEIAVDLTGAGGGYECPSATLRTSCAKRVTQLLCTTCECVCDCLCVRVPSAVPPFNRVCRGEVCWDKGRQAYSGTIACTGLNYSGHEIQADVEFAIRPRWQYDPYASPYDERCVIVFNSYTMGFTDAWQPLDSCENGLSLEWSRQQDGYPITVMTTCIKCDVPCIGPCCDQIDEPWPDPISGTLTVETGGHCPPFLITFIGEYWGGHADDPNCDFCLGNCGPYVTVYCTQRRWFVSIGCANWGSEAANVVVQCNPFEITADYIDPYGPTPGTCGTFSIRITEAVN